MNKQNYGPGLNSRKAVRDIYVFIFVSVIFACDVRHYSSCILSHKVNQFYNFICWKMCLFFTGLRCGLCWILFSYPWVSVSGFFFFFLICSIYFSLNQHLGMFIIIVWASLVVQNVKNPPAMLETGVPSLGWDCLLEKAMADLGFLICSIYFSLNQHHGMLLL